MKTIDAFMNITGQFLVYPGDTVDPKLQFFFEARFPETLDLATEKGAYLQTWLKFSDWFDPTADPVQLVCRTAINNEFEGSVS